MKSILLFGALAALSLAQQSNLTPNCECEPTLCPINRHWYSEAYCTCYRKAAEACAKKCGRPLAVLKECNNVAQSPSPSTISTSTVIIETPASTREPIPVTTSPLPDPTTPTPATTTSTSPLLSVPLDRGCKCKRQACPMGSVTRWCACKEQERIQCWQDCGGRKPEPSPCGDGFMPPKRDALLPLPTKRAEPRQLMGVPECSSTKPCKLGYTCAHFDCAYGMIDSANCGAKCVLDPALSLFPPVAGGLADLINDLASLGKRNVPRQIMGEPECSEEDPCEEGSVCIQLSGANCRTGMINSENCGAQCVPDPFGAVSSTFGIGSLTSSIDISSRKLRHRQIVSEPGCSLTNPCAAGYICAKMKSMDCRYIDTAVCGAKCIPDTLGGTTSLPSTLAFSLGSTSTSSGSLASTISSTIQISKERRQIMSEPVCSDEKPCEAGYICIQLDTLDCRYGQVTAENCGAQCIPDPTVSQSNSLGLSSVTSSISIGKERRQIMGEPECSDEKPCEEGYICIQRDSQSCRYGQITAENCGAQCILDPTISQSNSFGLSSSQSNSLGLSSSQSNSLGLSSVTSSISIGKERRQLMGEPECSDENPCADGFICLLKDTLDCLDGQVTAENCGAQCVPDPTTGLSSSLGLGSLSSSISIGSKKPRQIMGEPECSDENPCAVGFICILKDTLDCLDGQVTAENCGAQCVPDPTIGLSSSLGLGSLSSSISIGSKERRQLMGEPECSEEKPCGEGFICIQKDTLNCLDGQVTAENCGAQCIPDPTIGLSSSLGLGSLSSSISIGSKKRRQLMGEPECSEEKPCGEGFICIQKDTLDCLDGQVTTENCGAQCVPVPTIGLSSSLGLGSLSSSISIGSKERRQLMGEPECSDEKPCGEGLICIQLDTLNCRYGQITAENCGAKCIPDPLAAVPAQGSTLDFGSISSSISIGNKERRQIMNENECDSERPCAAGLICVQLASLDCEYGTVTSKNCGAKCMADPGAIGPVGTLGSASATVSIETQTASALPDPAAFTIETTPAKPTTTTTSSQNEASAVPVAPPSQPSDPPVQSGRQKPAPQKCQIPGATRDAKTADSPCPSSQRCFNPASRQVTDVLTEGWCTGMTCGGEMQRQCPSGQVCVAVPRGLQSVTAGASRGICAFEEMACRRGHDEDCGGRAFACAAVLGKEGDAKGVCALRPS